MVNSNGLSNWGLVVAPAVIIHREVPVSPNGPRKSKEMVWQYPPQGLVQLRAVMLLTIII